MEVRPGEIVTLLGRNGAGKSTALKSIMCLMEKRRGSIRFEGVETIGMAPHRIARLGLTFCPEDRGIHASLTAGERLELPSIIRPGGMSTEQVRELFPGLRNPLTSPGTKLSGGEQQMLAIGRILRTGARALLLDEPMEGLAPVVVKEIGVAIRRLTAARVPCRAGPPLTVLLHHEQSLLAERRAHGAPQTILSQEPWEATG